MNKPGIAGKGTNPYLKKNKGGQGPLSTGFKGVGTGIGDFEVGTKINSPGEVPYTYSGDPSTQVGKYAFSNNSISSQPVLDNRGFFGRIFQPNTAGDINQKIALEKVTREELIPLIAKEEETKQGIITQSVLERLKNEQKLNQPFQPVVNNFNSPGEVPFEYAGDPSALLADRQNQPYVPINPKGVEGNLAQQQALAQNQRGVESAALGKSQLALAQEQLALDKEKFNAPTFLHAGNTLLKYSPGSGVSEIGTYNPGDKGGEPILGTDAKGQPVLQGFSKPTVGRFQMAPKRVGNIYQGGGATSPYIRPELQQSQLSLGPATTQQNSFVTGSRDGMKTEVKGPAGGAPTTEQKKEESGFDSEKMKRDFKWITNAWRWLKTGGSPALGYDPIR